MPLRTHYERRFRPAGRFFIDFDNARRRVGVMVMPFIPDVILFSRGHERAHVLRRGGGLAEASQERVERGQF